MVYVFGQLDEWELDEDLWELRQSGVRVKLQPKVLALLFHLARNAERVVPREELLRELWPGESVTPSSVARALSLARTALASGRAGPPLIETVSRRGHRLQATARISQRSQATASSPAFVGREEMLDDLDRLLAAGGSTLVLRGEAGVGKTRLMEEACRRALRTGATILSAWCAPVGGQPSLWPWMRLARSVLARRPSLERGLSPRFRRFLRSSGEGMGERRRPARTHAAEELQAGSAVFEILDGIVGLLQELGRESPLVVTIDDLQWADDSSLHVFELACRDLQRTRDLPGPRVLVIATLRDGEPGKRAALRDCLAAVARLPGTTSVTLERLPRRDADALARSLWGAEPPESVVESVWLASQGNPLFITELIRHLRSQSGERSVPHPGGALPESLRALLAARLEGLTPPLRALTELAAVVAAEPDLPLLRACLSLSTEDLAEQLDALLAQGIFEPAPGSPGRLRFGHPLIRDAVLASLPPSRRIELHERVAGSLEEAAGADPESVAEEVAEHRLTIAHAGGPIGPATDWAERAGRVALGRGGYQEAAASFQAALEVFRLEHGRDATRELSLVLQLGRARARANDLEGAADAAEQAARLARRLDDAEALAHASLTLFVRGPESGGPYERVVRLLEEAEECTRGSPGPLRARVLARLCNELFFTSGEIDRRVALAGEARALVERADVETRLFVGYHTLIGTWSRLRASERVGITAELAALADESGDPANRFMVSPPYLASRLEAGRLEEVDAEIEGLARKVERLEVPSFFQWYPPVYRGMRALMDGRLEEAEALIVEGRDLGLRARSQDAARNFAGQFGTLRFEQDRNAEVEAAMRSMREHFARISVWRAGWLRALALLGRLEEARAELEAWQRDGFPDPLDDSNGVVSLVLLAETCAELGAAGAAAELLPSLSPYAGENAAPAFGAVCLGPVDLALGGLARVCGRTGEAIAHLEAAERNGERQGARPTLARARLERAKALAERGRTGDLRQARELARSSLALAESVGLPDVARRAGAWIGGPLELLSRTHPRAARKVSER